MLSRGKKVSNNSQKTWKKKNFQKSTILQKLLFTGWNNKTILSFKSCRYPKNIKFEKRGLSLLLHICLHQIHNNGIVICRLNIEYGFCFTSAAVRICVFEKLFFLEVSSSEATKSYSNYFKRLQKRKCVLLYLEIFFFRRVVFCQKKNPSSPRKSSFFRKCPSTYLTTLKWKKKNWVSFNKNLELHFVKKNPTFSNREIQCEKSDTCHCHTLYY